jgi:hypothetical protein
MRVPPQSHPFKTLRCTGVLTFYCLIGFSLVAPPAFAELLTGRDAKGTLWISDRGLPSDIRPIVTGAPEVAGIPQLQTSTGRNETARVPDTTTVSPSNNSQPKSNRHEKDRTTCDGIDQRYAGARANLTSVEQKKASGQLLIPDSGLMTMRQNLATLERLRALCQ